MEQLTPLLDKAILQPNRLGLLLHLVRHGGRVPYQSVWRDHGAALGIPGAGSLTKHHDALTGAGYLTVEKSFVNRRPQTMLVITPKGRAALTALSSMTSCAAMADTAT
jgi:DNA-binding MarR family transcriptional regulator